MEAEKLVFKVESNRMYLYLGKVDLTVMYKIIWTIERPVEMNT
jgi:hypothetical protein